MYGRSPVGKGTEEVPILGTSNIDMGMIFEQPHETVSVENARKVNRYRISAGDVLLTIRGSGFRTAVCEKETEGYLISSNLCSIRLLPDSPIGPYLLCSILSSSSGERALKTISQGSSIISIRPKSLYELEFDVPDPSQSSILEALAKESMNLAIQTRKSLEIRERIMGEVAGSFIRGL